MELDRTYNEEEQRGALSYSIGVETRGEEETRSTKNNMEENGWRWKTSSWVVLHTHDTDAMLDLQSELRGLMWLVNKQ